MADIVSAEQLKNGINNALNDNSELFSVLENAVGETGATQVLNELSKMGEEMAKETLEGSNTPNLTQANQATAPTPTAPPQRRTEPTTQPESEPSIQPTIEQPTEETKENEEKIQPQETEEEPQPQTQYQPFGQIEENKDALPWQRENELEEPEENEEMEQDENAPQKEPTARELDQQKAQAVRQAVNLGQEKQQRVQQIQAEQTATEKEKEEKKEAGGIKGFSDYMVWFVARDLIFIFFGVIPFIGPIIAGPFTLVGVILTFALYYKQDNSSKVAIGKEIAGKSYMYGIMYLISMTLAIFTLDKLLKLKSKTSPLGATKGAGQPGGRPSATSTKPTK